MTTEDRPITSAEPQAMELAVADDVFMENVREAVDNGYNLVCSRCGVGVNDDSDIHERRCPEYVEPTP